MTTKTKKRLEFVEIDGTYYTKDHLRRALALERRVLQETNFKGGK